VPGLKFLFARDHTEVQILHKKKDDPETVFGIGGHDNPLDKI
jgi:hypothetical protein